MWAPENLEKCIAVGETLYNIDIQVFRFQTIRVESEYFSHPHLGPILKKKWISILGRNQLVYLIDLIDYDPDCT